jgi:hypothetical protein
VKLVDVPVTVFVAEIATVPAAKGITKALVFVLIVADVVSLNVAIMLS